MSLSADLRAVLARDPQAEWRPRDLRDALGLSGRRESKNVTATLTLMVQAGQAVRTGKGHYRLGQGQALQRENTRDRQDGPTSAANAAAQAARSIVQGLRQRGIRVSSVAEAIKQGHLTDLQWCATLDEFRERYGVGHTPVPSADLFTNLPRKRAV